MANLSSQHARFGSGKAVRRVEDEALLTGKGRFADDVNAAGEAARCVPALAASACAHRRDRHGRRRRVPRRDRGHHRRGSRPRRREAAAAVRRFPSCRWLADGHAAPACARPRRRPSCRRGGGRRGRGKRRAGAGRDRGHRRSLRAAADGCRGRPRGCGGRAARLERGLRQHRMRVPPRRRRSNRGGVSQGRARGAPRPPEPARRAVPDRAARDPRCVRCQDGSADAHRELPDADRVARRARRGRARHSEGEGARAGGRCRRRLRDEDEPLSRGRRRRVLRAPIRSVRSNGARRGWTSSSRPRTAAISRARRSSRWTRTGASSRCASTRSPTSAPMPPAAAS